MKNSHCLQYLISQSENSLFVTTRLSFVLTSDLFHAVISPFPKSQVLWRDVEGLPLACQSCLPESCSEKRCERRTQKTPHWILGFQNSKEGLYPTGVCCLTVFSSPLSTWKSILAKTFLAALILSSTHLFTKKITPPHRDSSNQCLGHMQTTKAAVCCTKQWRKQM